MAERLHVSSAYLSKLERGKCGQPSAVLIDQICAMLGLIWDDAENLKNLALVSRPRVVIDTENLGSEATHAANLFAALLPQLDDREIQAALDWLHKKKQDLKNPSP